MVGQYVEENIGEKEKCFASLSLALFTALCMPVFLCRPEDVCEYAYFCASILLVLVMIAGSQLLVMKYRAFASFLLYEIRGRSMDKLI